MEEVNGKYTHSNSMKYLNKLVTTIAHMASRPISEEGSSSLFLSAPWKSIITCKTQQNKTSLLIKLNVIIIIIIIINADEQILKLNFGQKKIIVKTQQCGKDERGTKFRHRKIKALDFKLHRSWKKKQFQSSFPSKEEESNRNPMNGTITTRNEFDWILSLNKT